MVGVTGQDQVMRRVVCRVLYKWDEQDDDKEQQSVLFWILYSRLDYLG